MEVFHMKKSILLMFVLLSAAFAMNLGLASAASAAERKKISVVAANFPPYDFAKAIAGDKADVTILLRPGAESHTYDPTPADIIAVQNCDVFIRVGGTDAWAEKILSATDASGMKVITMLDCVDAVEEEIVEGMQEEEEEEDKSHDGVFEDSDARDRELSDWQGNWKSGLPYLEDGTLDEGLRHKAENGERTYDELKAYYKTGYQTDFDRIEITGDSIAFYAGSVKRSAKYEYKGFVIMNYESGKKGVRYQFEATDRTSGAPRYIQFSDHNIRPTEGLTHYHIYYGDESFEKMLKQLENWPTYYASAMTADDVAKDFAGHGHSHEEELDEHVWTSPKNAKKIVQAISDALCEADETNADLYRSNTAAYLEKLDDLDKAFQAAVNSARRKTLVVGDRFPFRYLADAYGLKYFAAFPGCSTETEPSAATVAFLIKKVKEEKIPVVFHIELSNEKLADTIIEGTGAKKLLLHSCHNVSRSDHDKDVTYINLMTKNVEAIKEALK
jgi:zinc transport system substrate-binding protein